VIWPPWYASIAWPGGPDPEPYIKAVRAYQKAGFNEWTWVRLAAGSRVPSTSSPPGPAPGTGHLTSADAACSLTPDHPFRLRAARAATAPAPAAAIPVSRA
jgi:hypothetical protein